MLNTEEYQDRKNARQALVIWVLFFASTAAINLLLPFAFGFSFRDWTNSDAKGLLLFSIDYAGFFLVLPLVLTKGWRTFKKPGFAIPVTAAAISVVLWHQIYFIATIAIVVYVYLHLRFDLSDLGFRSKGWKGDTAAIMLVGGLGLIQALSSSNILQFALLPATYSALFRLFGNPASTVENLFYFGFLTERIGKRWSRYAVPFLIGALYVAHEMTNPEYWYTGVSFAFIFVGVTVFAAVYLWRRSIVVTWLSDGFRWFLSLLL
jgi:hypothetical protein